MKFVVGLLGGVVLGAVAAVAYSVQTGRDLREEYQAVRSELSRGDLDALGARLESRVSEMQTLLEARLTEVRERAGTAMQEAGVPVSTLDEAAAATADAAEGAVEAAADKVKAAADKVDA